MYADCRTDDPETHESVCRGCEPIHYRQMILQLEMNIEQQQDQIIYQVTNDNTRNYEQSFNSEDLRVCESIDRKLQKYFMIGQHLQLVFKLV